MSEIEAKTPAPAAAAPSHPDHAHWVKDAMLAREVSWLRSLGVEPSHRKVDVVIDAGLQRLAARKREGRPLEVRRDVTPIGAGERLAGELGGRLIRRPIRRRRAPVHYECKRCGTCVRCKRERRGMRIIELARAGDTQAFPLAMDIVKATMKAQARLGPFEQLRGSDADKLLTRILEDACDRSTSFMGQWR